MGFLHEDGPITSLLSRFTDLLLVNVFWVICCLPIVTIGASTTAMYDVCMKLALHEEIGVIKTFFQSFVRHLKRGTLLFLLATLAGAVLLVDLWAVSRWGISYKFLFQVVILSVGYFYVATVSHAVPALAYFGEPVIKTIRHAFILAMRNGIYTVFVMLMDLLPVLLLFVLPDVFWKMFYLWLTIGIGVLTYLNSLHLVRLFDPKRVKELHERLAEEEMNKKKGR